MPPSEWIAIGGLFLSLIITAVGLTLYMASLKSDTIVARADIADKINVTKELFYTVVKAEVEKEAKLRHDMANHFQMQMASVDTDISAMNRRFDQVVHKEDLHATEARLVTALDKLEHRIERVMETGRGGNNC